MITVHCMQGSPEWKQARAGVITGSNFSLVRKRVGGLNEQQQAYVDAMCSGKTKAEAMLVAGYRASPKAAAIDRALSGERVGDFSDAAKDYAFRLAIERISGEPLDEGFETWQMRRGHELEPAARAAHEIAAGVIVEPCGFVMTDDKAFGISADGFIGEDTGTEYKCLIAPDRLRSILIDEDLSEFHDQCQGGMWITGRKAWHFGLYCPALAPLGKEFVLSVMARDDNYIEAMELDLLEFKALVDQNETMLRASSERKAA